MFKKVRGKPRNFKNVKPNVTLARKTTFIVKCNVAASMKRNLYEIYEHLCKKNVEMYFMLSIHVKQVLKFVASMLLAVLCQLGDITRNLMSMMIVHVLDLLQQWHVPGETENSDAILFSDLTFEKAYFDKVKNESRERPLVCGKRKFCATPLLAHKTSLGKL